MKASVSLHRLPLYDVQVGWAESSLRTDIV